MKSVVAIALGLVLFATPSFAQLQQGTIVGSLVGPSGAVIGDAQITLFDQLGNAVTTVTASNGQFRLTNVAIGSYSLKAEAPPFEAVVQTLTVADAIPITLELKLSAALAEQVNVTAETNQPVTTTTRTTLAGDAVRRAPIRISSRGLQDAIATTPGWATEDNGLLHARGVDDGFLYVVDGVPMYERMDSAHGIAPDLEMVESVNVLVGHVPPEFGFKSGGVIEVRTSSRQGSSWLGNVQASTASDATHQGSSVFGGPLSASTAVTVGLSGQRSDRFLDPVHPDNLHNAGNAANGTAEFSWLIVSFQHALGGRRVRAFEFRRAAQRGPGGSGAGPAAEESADMADRVVAARMVGRHGIAGRCVSSLGVGQPVGHRTRHAAVHQRRPHAAARRGARKRHASSRQARSQSRCRGRTLEPARRLHVLRHG